MPQGIRRVSNPPNPFTGRDLEWYEDWLEPPPSAALEVYEEQAKSIVSENKSPDIGFRYSINPYRGCFHGCSYCYARPTHQYLDFGAGSDFEKKVVVKVNAPQLLEQNFRKKSWNGETVMFSGVTDCYQPLELNYELTRRCLEVCLRYGNPVSIITKAVLIQRDAELLRELHEKAGVKVYISLAFSEAETARRFEPHTPSPAARLRTMKLLAETGIPVGVAIAPVIPGVSEVEVPAVVEAAARSGATSAFMTLLRLPAEVEPVFLERVQASYPERAARIIGALREMKEGKLNRSEFGARMTGTGARWEAIEWLFKSTCQKFGIRYADRKEEPVYSEVKSRSPEAKSVSSPSKSKRTQLNLFDS